MAAVKSKETGHDRDSAGNELHRLLSSFNRKRLSPGLPTPSWRRDIDEMAALLRLEGEFLEAQRQAVRESASAAPVDPAGFTAWFESLKINGPGQGDPLFPWLAEKCSMEEMKWFLTQEVAGEAGFEDLTALTQVKLPTRAKLELARNYWDEMGRGNARGMHGPLLAMLANRLGLEPRDETTVWDRLLLRIQWRVSQQTGATPITR
jgi:hypothetical protein